MENRQVTELLEAGNRGDKAALDKLFPLIYDELRIIANALLKNERPNHTLQPTALVHEAFMRLTGTESAVAWQNRAHFFGIAARSMRQILVNYANARNAEKRGGAVSREQLTIDAAVDSLTALNVEILDLHSALEKLAQLDETAERIVELRFFGGLTHEEVAEVLNITVAAARREWEMAKTWLYAELKKSD
ncbi:MAG: sigma-70 family RNA polymerase sigma factor [Acidobacteriota bacterium]|nr:sigma-70 family RNA polymerase sigma factor [Acidobacteriota bacterium]